MLRTPARYPWLSPVRASLWTSKILAAGAGVRLSWAAQDKPCIWVPFLIKPATRQPGVTCFFLPSLLTLCWFQIPPGKLPEGCERVLGFFQRHGLHGSFQLLHSVFFLLDLHFSYSLFWTSVSIQWPQPLPYLRWPWTQEVNQKRVQKMQSQLKTAKTFIVKGGKNCIRKTMGV